MARVNVPVTTLGFQAASYTTALSGSNNDLVYTARNKGPGGNDITIEYVVSGTNTALAVAVYGHAITVTVATDGGGAATSTASQVKAAIEANSDGNALVSIALSGADTGAGVVTSLSATALSGGALGVARPSQTSSDATNDHYLSGNDGNVYIEVENTNASPQTVDFLLSPAYLAGLDGTNAVQTETVTNGTTRWLGKFPVEKFGSTVLFNPSVSTDLKFRAFQHTRT